MWLPKKSYQTASDVFTMWVVTSPCWNYKSWSFSSSSAMNWLKMFIIICSNCLFKEQWTHNLYSRQCVPSTYLWWRQWIFMQCMWLFSTPYSALLTINVSPQMEPCFIHKKQIMQHTDSITHKTTPMVILNSCVWLEDDALIWIKEATMLVRSLVVGWQLVADRLPWQSS